jgi:deoxyribodipyrimidine photolyase
LSGLATTSLQWGSGADAAPYFRMFNPLLQGAKFDPEGAYVRRWVPELKRLPAPLVHGPWNAAPLELKSAGGGTRTRLSQAGHRSQDGTRARAGLCKAAQRP